MSGNRAQINKIDTQKIIHFTTDRIAKPPFITINMLLINEKNHYKIKDYVIVIEFLALIVKS
jgi:hypothetical protein